MQSRRFFLIGRLWDSGTLEVIEEHVTSMIGILEGTGEIGVYFAVFGNENMWTRPMVDEQYEVLERLSEAAFFARLGHRAVQPDEGR